MTDTDEQLNEIEDKQTEVWKIADKSEDLINNLKINPLESVEKIPQLETENYKIDKDMSVEEKLKNWRTKEIDANGIVYLEKNLSYGYDAYVWEYLEWVDNELIWEQKFTWNAIARIPWLWKKMPKDYEQFLKIIGNDYQDFIKKNFSKNGKLMLSGMWHPGNKAFTEIGERDWIWLWSGNNISLSKFGSFHYGLKGSMIGYSVRCIKD